MLKKNSSFRNRAIKTGFLTVVTALLLATCSGGAHIIATEEGDPKDADMLLVVDCLLPGRIQKLGTTVYVTPRQPAKLTAKACEERGGEYTKYNEANTASALKVWLEAAKSGDKIAQTYVGEIYEKGRGLEPDFKTAAQWYSLAAKQGYSRAKLNLGYLYEKGLGVPQNIKMALALYREASGMEGTNVEYVADMQATDAAGSHNLLADLKRELESERARVKTLKESVAAKEKSFNDQQQVLGQMEQALHQQQSALETEMRKASADKKKISQLQMALNQREKDIKTQREQTASLKQQLEQYKTELAGMETDTLKVAVAGPSIQLINPPLLSVRGVQKIPISQQIKTREIVGQVSAPAGVSRLMVNNEAVQPNPKGIFKYLAQISHASENMRILAVDGQGKQAELEFEFVYGQQQAIAKPPKPLAPSAGFGKFYALVIGNNQYTNFPQLSTAVSDAEEVSKILSSRYGFETTTLVNAGRYRVLAALNRLAGKLSANDNLLIYYAGHGELDDKETGYWLPVDADRKDRQTWISNTAVTDILNAMDVKRVLIVADSCYSGALTRSAIAQIDTSVSDESRLAILRTLSKSKARTALTSGGLKPVADKGEGNHSVFASAFLQVLQQNSDIMEGQKLHRQIYARMAVSPIAAQTGQVPEYAPIQHAGHESGEFFLYPRGDASAMLEAAAKQKHG